MTFPFHPLADIFPLIEGAEFNELVASIRDNGQREAIVLLEGSILDGRNRFHACAAAGVEPRFEEFTGSDPVKFVVDVNVRRRHLNESQRAMIAAKLAQLKNGQRADYANRNAALEISIAATDAAKMMNVDPHTVFSAKKVLNEGTAEEIKAVQEGKAAVSTLAREIRAKAPKDQRAQRRAAPLMSVGKNPERIENMRINAEIWDRLSTSLANLTNLPLPSDVAAIVASNASRVRAVDDKIENALKWIKEFSDAWRNRDQAAA